MCKWSGGSTGAMMIMAASLLHVTIARKFAEKCLLD